MHAGWQNGEPLDALPAMFSPLQCTLVVEGRASPAKWPSKEREHLEVKSQLPLHPSSDRKAAEQYKRVSSATATANSFQSNISYKNKLLFSDYELLLCFLHHAQSVQLQSHSGAFMYLGGVYKSQPYISNDIFTAQERQFLLPLKFPLNTQYIYAIGCIFINLPLATTKQAMAEDLRLQRARANATHV